MNLILMFFESVSWEPVSQIRGKKFKRIFFIAPRGLPSSGLRTGGGVRVL